MENTIASISTPLGKGAISIVRMSGNEALKIAQESLKIDKGLAESELKTFCDYADLSYKKLMLKAKLYSKRWW